METKLRSSARTVCSLNQDPPPWSRIYATLPILSRSGVLVSGVNCNTSSSWILLPEEYAALGLGKTWLTLYTILGLHLLFYTNKKEWNCSLMRPLGGYPRGDGKNQNLQTACESCWLLKEARASLKAMRRKKGCQPWHTWHVQNTLKT